MLLFHLYLDGLHWWLVGRLSSFWWDFLAGHYLDILLLGLALLEFVHWVWVPSSFWSVFVPLLLVHCSFSVWPFCQHRHESLLGWGIFQLLCHLEHLLNPLARRRWPMWESLLRCSIHLATNWPVICPLCAETCASLDRIKDQVLANAVGHQTVLACLHLRILWATEQPQGDKVSRMCGVMSRWHGVGKSASGNKYP